jgi:type IV conjugative transfer system protein TraL
MVRIPQYLSLPPRFIWFDMDDLLVGLVPILFAMLFNLSLLFSVITAGIAMALYIKNKEKASRGFLFHIYYMLGGKFQGFESVHIRRYQE